ncbi:ferrochelatase [Spirochaetota bacterium]|nr:ferrochelatase [Spirochaetota bacterium]
MKKLSPKKKSATRNARAEKRVIVLINLGTPKSTRVADVRRYLFQFLMDPCVIDIPYPARLALVGGIIAPLRAFSSSKSYREIWTEKGSPLLSLSEDLKEKIQARTSHPVFLAMRYGIPAIAPTIKAALSSIDNKGILHIIPLYPQHAMSTTLTVYREVQSALSALTKENDTLRNNVKVIYEAPFYNNTAYLNALAAQIKPYIKKLGTNNGYDYLLFSYHGIPIRHLNKIDAAQHCNMTTDCCNRRNAQAHAVCYRHQLIETTKAIEKRLKIPSQLVGITFQSRLGSNWLTPYTDMTVKMLPRKGIKKLLVVTPAFVTDNLETLFEVAIENKDFFKEAGGEKLTLIPCLNTEPRWINCLMDMIAKPRDFTAALETADRAFTYRTAAT